MSSRSDELLTGALVDVWVVDVRDPKTTSEVLKFLKDHIRIEPELKHLKRVCRRRGEDGRPLGDSPFTVSISVSS